MILLLLTFHRFGYTGNAHKKCGTRFCEKKTMQTPIHEEKSVVDLVFMECVCVVKSCLYLVSDILSLTPSHRSYCGKSVIFFGTDKFFAIFVAGDALFEKCNADMKSVHFFSVPTNTVPHFDV